MRLYMVRHGETLLNQKKCYYGVTDAALSDRGVRQAQTLSAAFRDISFDYVISSPLVRAVRTAEIIMGHGSRPAAARSGERAPDRQDSSEPALQSLAGPGVLIRTDDRLKEQNFGIFEGLTHRELTERYPREYDAWNQDFSGYRIPGGESFSDVRQRVDSFVADLPDSGTVLVAAHKGSLGHMIASLLGLPLNGYWNFVFDQDCYSCIDIEDGYAIVRCLNRRPV